MPLPPPDQSGQLKPADPKARERARQLRRDSSMPERILWSRLRNRRLGGLKFRRQHPIGPYTADFYCAEAALVVEIDGESHWTHVLQDRTRNHWMRDTGYEVLRFTGQELMKHEEGVLGRILDVARARIGLSVERGEGAPGAFEDPHPRPLPRGEGA